MQRFLRIIIILFFYFSHFKGYGQVIFETLHNIKVLDGAQEVEMPWIGGLNSCQYNKADLDGDGREELILYDRSGEVYLIFKTEGSTIIPANELKIYLPDIPPGWILFIDYNGDGRKDIFSNGDRGVIVFKNIAESGKAAQWKKVADPLLTTGFSGKINLIANAADVPAISDIDSDGDYDILVYNFAIGGHIRYNKNLSMELFGHADSLEYEISTRTWGEFEECDCNLFAFNGETCEGLANGKVMHAGGKALLAYDDDGDGDKDLLVGHEQCIELYFYENMGDPDSAYMVDFSNEFPNAANPANFHVFPAGFMEDLDFDGVKDLVVTPGFGENVEYKIDFGHSNWFYRNIGSNEIPDFVFEQDNFIQDRTIDFGEHTVPVFSDLNADGRTDSLLASNGYWNGQVFSGQVIEFQNSGTLDSPSFVVKNKNYLDLASLEIINPKIGLVDFDGDRAKDLTYSGFQLPNKVISWVFINQAKVGEPFSFDPDRKQRIDLPETTTISDHPTFYDVDQDGYVDLLLGKSAGALEYHKNDGDNSFSLIDPAYLGIERDFSLERLNLVASIGDLDLNGKSDLIATDSRGLGRVYFDFQSQTGDYISVDLVQKNEISDELEPLTFDKVSWITSSDVHRRGKESLIAGGARGGVQFFQSTSIDDGNGGSDLEVKIFPNPISDQTGLHINTDQDVEVELISMLGQTIIRQFHVERFTNAVLDVNHLRNGTYILRARAVTGASKSLLLMILR